LLAVVIDAAQVLHFLTTWKSSIVTSRLLAHVVACATQARARTPPMSRSAKRAKKAADKAASAAQSAPLRAVDLGHAFVRGGDIKTLIATDASKATRGGANASGTHADDDIDRIDAATLAASYKDAERTVEVRQGFDFRALATDASAASWSLFGGSSRAVAQETVEGNVEVPTTSAAKVDDDTPATGMVSVPPPPERATAPAAPRKKRPPRPIRAPVSAVDALGVGHTSGIDVMARAWHAPGEKEMLEKWHASVEDFRDDYKRKRRAALRHKKGVGSAIVLA